MTIRQSRPLTLSREQASARMTDVEQEIPITKLLASVGLCHFPCNGISREVRNATTDELVGFYSAGEAVILYVELRDGGIFA